MWPGAPHGGPGHSRMLTPQADAVVSKQQRGAAGPGCFLRRRDRAVRPDGHGAGPAAAACPGIAAERAGGLLAGP